MPDIFLSYSREDDATATRFAEAFKRAGFSVWWDRVLRSGETYDEVTERALREAKAVVVLWSRHSVNSRWVRSEAKIADRNGTLIPVMIEACERPVMFELMQSADLTHWKGDTRDRVWCAVVDDVRRLVGGESNTQSFPVAIRRHRIRRIKAALAFLLMLMLIGAASWWLLSDRNGFSVQKNGRLPTIAVLPFVDMTLAGKDTPLAEGLSEEISNWLAHIPELNVVARTSAFKYRGGGLDVRKVGRELDANYIIEGSVRRGKDEVRVTVQLVSTKDALHLWSHSYDLSDTDALHIEDTISRYVAETLKVRLSKETERRWLALSSSEPEAYDLYLQGQLEERPRTPEHNLRAMDLYRRALTQDPRFPLAYVSLAAATLNSITLNGRDLDVVASEVGPLLDQALALSPDMPEAIAAQGWLALVQFRTDDAFNLMQRALTLKPNDADTRRRMGNLFERLAQPHQSVEQYDLAAQLDPLDFLTQVYRCLGFQDLAQFEAAEAACAKARKLDDTSIWGPRATAWLAFGKGDLSGALRWTNRAARKAPENLALQGQRIHYLVALQQYDAASKALARMPTSAEPTRSFLKASIAAARLDTIALNALLDEISRRSGLSSEDWLALTRLQLGAGNTAAAKRSLERAKQSGDFHPEALVDSTQVKHGYSAALIVAAAEIATGNPDAGLRALTPFDEMLDRMERNGGACAGLYSLRAESLALRGEPERAMIALQQAYKQGWRLSQGARVDSYLHSLQKRKDFNSLLTRVDREIQSLTVEPFGD